MSHLTVKLLVDRLSRSRFDGGSKFKVFHQHVVTESDPPGRVWNKSFVTSESVLSFSKTQTEVILTVNCVPEGRNSSKKDPIDLPDW